jgi:hypothetical protein
MLDESLGDMVATPGNDDMFTTPSGRSEVSNTYIDERRKKEEMKEKKENKYHDCMIKVTR